MLEGGDGRVVELADTQVLEACVGRHTGSIPVSSMMKSPLSGAFFI